MHLEQKNYHSRDKNIHFEESTHTYTINNDNKYKSVTTWIHEFFPHFDADHVIAKMRSGKNWGPENKYFNMTDDEIKAQWKNNGKEASELGTMMHLNIEHYYNGLDFDLAFRKTKEYRLFKKYLQKHLEYVPYRTEWNVYTKKYRLAGSIDIVYIDPLNPSKVILADWKRSKEIKFTNKWEQGFGPLHDMDHCNYNHYTLQLNLYRMILEKYYQKEVSAMFLVILHPNNDTYLKIKIPRVWKPIMAMLKQRLQEIAGLP